MGCYIHILQVLAVVVQQHLFLAPKKERTKMNLTILVLDINYTIVQQFPQCGPWTTKETKKNYWSAVNIKTIALPITPMLSDKMTY